MTRSKPYPHGDGSSPQSRVVAFLAAPGVFDDAAATVHETHAAMVFVGAMRALKIKRAVRLPYLDYSTLERRRAACVREVEVNHEAAPDLYLGVVPIIERDDGSLAIGGPGSAVEWAVEMRAFAQTDLLSSRAAAGELPASLLRATADVVFAMHARAPVRLSTDPVAKMRAIAHDIASTLRRYPARRATVDGSGDIAADIAAFEQHAETSIADASATLRGRAGAGCVRRCHGDLHLANIVVWKGRPTPFDAIEFSEEIATVDTLYDLAFLLMDLDHGGNRAAANLVLDRYLSHARTRESLAGLKALPLFLSLRAGIRAMVSATRLGQLDDATPGAETARGDLERYLADAVAYLTPARPSLIAVGGLSGTGKSTLAASLAPAVASCLGAVHLRSDVERKAMLGVGETDRLAPDSYTAEMSDRVYARLYDLAAAILASGHSVVVDAVFQKETERAAIAAIAAAAAVPFHGLWLVADRDTMCRRVASRRGDASDATAEVVDLQLARAVGAGDPGLGWQIIDASGEADHTRAAALALIPAAALAGPARRL